MKRILKVIGAFLLILVFVMVSIIGYLTIDEYRPEDIEKLELNGKAGENIATGKETTIMSWNLGYAALGDNADFFMDGGKMIYSSDKERVNENLLAFSNKVDEIAPDILFFQEIDRSSSRSYFTDEFETIIDTSDAEVTKYQNAFAYNFHVAYVPVPVPPIGKVHAGLSYMSVFNTRSAERYSLPCPFSWPLRTFNLKRCLEIMKLPVEGSEKELVLINLHLEAYDEGEGKIAQTNMLKEIMHNEAAKGNYVIVGGDFNQSFSSTDISMYPRLEGTWQPGVIDVSDFGNEFSFYADNTVPTGRSLDSVLEAAPQKDPEHFQYYMLDGYIVSSNVQVNKMYTLDTGFMYTDHNPVIMSFTLIGE